MLFSHRHCDYFHSLIIFPAEFGLIIITLPPYSVSTSVKLYLLLVIKLSFLIIHERGFSARKIPCFVNIADLIMKILSALGTVF